MDGQVTSVSAVKSVARDEDSPEAARRVGHRSRDRCMVGCVLNTLMYAVYLNHCKCNKYKFIGTYWVQGIT